jgi:hypothetical protein
MNILRIFGRKLVRKIYVPIKEEESCRIRTSKEIQDILQAVYIVRFVKPLRPIRYSHHKMTNN